MGWSRLIERNGWSGRGCTCALSLLRLGVTNLREGCTEEEQETVRPSSSPWLGMNGNSDRILPFGLSRQTTLSEWPLSSVTSKNIVNPARPMSRQVSWNSALPAPADRQNSEVEAREAYDKISLREDSLAEESSIRMERGDLWKKWTLKPAYQRIFARFGLALIVFVPLLLMPIHGFMRANGLDDLLLAAYSLLGASFVLVVILAPPEAESQPNQIISSTVRGAYAASWLLAPVLSHSVDIAAYATIPLGIVGMLVVRHPCSLWFADIYVLAMLIAPSASITLAHTLDLQDTRVVVNVSVAEWQAHAFEADAFAFNDGYVATQWRGVRSEWSHETGSYGVGVMTSAYGVAPVVPNRQCIVNASEFAGERTSRCAIAMMVMYSQSWEDRTDSFADLSEGGRGTNHVHGSCRVNGHVGSKAKAWSSHPARGGGLCVYADPLYRAPRGTPPRAVEECRMLLRRHALHPLSICDAQFFLVDHDEDHRRKEIVHHSMASCALFVLGVVIGLAPRTRVLSERLRSGVVLVFREARSSVIAIEMI